MQKRSFKIVSSLVLFFFLATPFSAFAQLNSGQSQQLLTLIALQQSGAITPEQTQQLLVLQALQNNQQGAGGNNLAQGVLLGSLLNNQEGGQNPGLLAALALGGGGFGAGGAGGQIGQALSLLGALTGNMGFLIAGMITSMIGGLGGATPQQGTPDEQYVGQGTGYGSGGSGLNNPYYPTPTPRPSQSPTPTPAATACAASIFIVKDTTVTPNVTKPYPAAISVAQNGCVLAINADPTSHTLELKKKNNVDYTAADRFTNIAGSQSHIFRFSAKNTYTFCVDSSASACTTVTVQ